MKVALVAPSGVPFVVGGAEKLWWGLAGHVNRHTAHEMELIKLPSAERDFWEIARSYEQFSTLDLLHFDAVISTKYPAWMVEHPCHVVYLQHTLRGLYDTYPAGLGTRAAAGLPRPAQALWRVLEGASCERALLPEIFGRVRELRGLEPQVLQPLTALPGPLARALVHKLDRIALQPRAIARYFAISRVVAGRKDYFPPGAAVEVLPHPSNLEGLRAGDGPGEFVFTASRLDAPKRIDLLIRAFRRCETQMPLWIAGDGPQAGALRALAQGDGRIRFLGRLTDDALAEHYRRAALVPFVPQQEDMGLITLEAMGAGKPVLTVEDAGGVTEFVEDGVNGHVVAPTEKALAGALQALLADRAGLARMGAAALQTAARVSWQRTADALLGAAGEALARNERQPPADGPPATAPAGGGQQDQGQGQRPRLLVLNTYGVYPPDSGGKKRLFYLYQGISRWADVTLLNLGEAGTAGELREFGPQVREVRVPPSAGFAQREAALARRLRRPVRDIAALLYWEHLAEFRSAFARLSAQADVVVAAHVYCSALAEAAWQGPVWYDAHNVEADMKADVLGVPRLAAPPAGGEGSEGRALAPEDFDPGAADAARQAVRVTAGAEARLVRSARRVLAVSETDRARLAALYGRAADAIELASNGTQPPADAWLDAPRRGALKQALGFGAAPLALFAGSYHGPNLQAADALLELAAACPGWHFAVVGSVCGHLEGRALPRNVHALGVVREAELTALLRAADAGLNPMATGSGTNLKMLDYAGHGALIVSTPEGARGLDLRAGVHYLEGAIAQFPALLHALAAQVPGPRPELRAAARAAVERAYAWDAIAARLRQPQQDREGGA